MRRWTVRILICPILGAITTVAVAWGCALWSSVNDERAISSEAVAIRTGFGIAHIGRTEELHAYGNAGSQFMTNASKEIVLFHFDPDLIECGWPTHCLRRHIGPGEPLAQLVHYFDARGRLRNGESGLEFGLLVTPLKRLANPESGGRLPLRPIWPGFVIDTLFYAAIWFGVFFGFTSAKRFIRSKRGRCPMCGYDLRGHRHEGTEARRHEGFRAGCPECGWGRE